VRYRIYKIENPLAEWTSINGAGESSKAAPAQHLRNSAAPFTVFHTARWRPERDAPGNAGEMAAFSLFILLLLTSSAGLWLFARTQRSPLPAPRSPLLLLAGN